MIDVLMVSRLGETSVAALGLADLIAWALAPVSAGRAALAVRAVIALFSAVYHAVATEAGRGAPGVGAIEGAVAVVVDVVTTALSGALFG